MENSFVTQIALMFSLWGTIVCAQDSSADSPQLTFESHRTAVEKKDWNSLFSTISPGYRDHMIFEALFAMGMNETEESKAIFEKHIDKTKLEELSAAHDSPPTAEEGYAILSQAIQDKKGMFVDCLSYVDRSLTDDSAKKTKLGPLEGLAIDDNVASAKSRLTTTIVYYSKNPGDAESVRHEEEVSTDISVYFIKSDGKWMYATKDEWKKHKSLDKDK